MSAGHTNGVKDGRWTSFVNTWRTCDKGDHSESSGGRPGQIQEGQDQAGDNAMPNWRRYADTFAKQPRDTTGPRLPNDADDMQLFYQRLVYLPSHGVVTRDL